LRAASLALLLFESKSSRPRLTFGGIGLAGEGVGALAIQRQLGAGSV
jgi:hypothetical protein